MAVRTNQAGIKHKREIDPRSTYPAQGATASRKKTLRGEAVGANRRPSRAARMKPGPAAKPSGYERGRRPPTTSGRKKPPSQMKLKREGGPRKASPLHGG